MFMFILEKSHKEFCNVNNYAKCSNHFCVVAFLSNSASDFRLEFVNPLSTNPIKRSNTLKQFVGNLQTNCLSVFDHFVELALKGLTFDSKILKG